MLAKVFHHQFVVVHSPSLIHWKIAQMEMDRGYVESFLNVNGVTIKTTVTDGRTHKVDDHISRFECQGVNGHNNSKTKVFGLDTEWLLSPEAGNCLCAVTICGERSCFIVPLSRFGRVPQSLVNFL